MSLAINARPATLIAQTAVKRGPEAVSRPSQESASQRTEKVNPKAEMAKAIDSAKVAGATVTHTAAQKLTDRAQPMVQDYEPDLPPDAPVYGDVNGDGELTTQDISSLMDAFRSSMDAADLNADGTVDTADLGMLISAIHEMNNKSRPADGPGNGPPSGDLNPLSALDAVAADSAQKLDSENKKTEANKRNPLAPAPGTGEDPVSQPAVYGDLDGNGTVDQVDLEMLQKAFGTEPGDGPMMGDINGDGRVDTADLGTMIGLMGKTDRA